RIKPDWIRRAESLLERPRNPPFVIVDGRNELIRQGEGRQINIVHFAGESLWQLNNRRRILVAVLDDGVLSEITKQLRPFLDIRIDRAVDSSATLFARVGENIIVDAGYVLRILRVSLGHEDECFDMTVRPENFVEQ